MHHCLCVAEQKIWCGDFPLSQTRSRKRWMVRAYSSSARCFWQHWWNRIALCWLLPFWNTPETQSSAVPLHQHPGVPACGSPRCSRHGTPRWVIPWWSLTSADWDSWSQRPHAFPRTLLSNVGMVLAATILLTSSQKICNPLTWVGTLHPWCRGWRGPYPKLWVTLVKKLPSPWQIGHTNTQAQMMSCLSDSKWGTWTTVWIGQPLCLWHTVSHLWMSTWWSNLVLDLVLEPDPLEMGGGNLLQDDWYLRYGKTRGLHPWEARSLTSHQNSTKQSKCLSPAGRRTIRSLM